MINCCIVATERNLHASESFVFLRPRSLIINPFIVYSIRRDDPPVTKSPSLMLRHYRRAITYTNRPGTVRVTISEYNGALATTTCTQRDNTRTYTIHYTHVCPRRTPVHSHVPLARTRTWDKTWCGRGGKGGKGYSFVSLGIRMTIVMRPLPEGFSAHNAIPLVTDNGPCNCSLPMALALFASPNFFFSRARLCDFHSRQRPVPFLVTPELKGPPPR